MSIQKKSISDFLQQLINEANESVETSKTKILYVYEQAKEEGYTPLEARKLIEEKIVNVTDRYIREVLPDEAKQTKHTPKRLKSNVERVPVPETPKDTPNENEFNLPPKKEQIIEIEPEKEELPAERRTPEAPDNSMVEQLHILNVQFKKEIDRLRDENIRLKQENQELKAELIKHRRLEELRLEAQRKAINQWSNPGHKP